MNPEALLAAPSLENQFPLEFHNGFRIATLAFWCLSCDKAIPLAKVHGHVGSIMKSVVDVTAAASCPCGHLNRYRIRLHDDATCTYLKNGEWVTEGKGNANKLSLFGRLRLQLLFLWIRWKCYWLARTLRIIQRDFREKHGLPHDG